MTDSSFWLQFQGMQMQFAEASTEIEAARLLTYNASRLKEEGKDFVKAAAMAKWYASKVAESVSSSAINWSGGIGFARDSPIEKYWRDSKVCLFLLSVVRAMTADSPLLLYRLEPSTREPTTFNS